MRSQCLCPIAGGAREAVPVSSATSFLASTVGAACAACDFTGQPQVLRAGTATNDDALLTSSNGALFNLVESLYQSKLLLN